MDPRLLALALSLTLPMDGGRLTGDYSLGISPTFGISVEFPDQLGGMALPGLVMLDPERQFRVGHELQHGEQQRALGPAFWPIYALSGGHEFEDYRGDGYMWSPDDFQMEEEFPTFKLSRQGDVTQFQVLPGYETLLDLLRRP